MAKMEVKTSLLDNMIGVGDMVLLEPLSEESFISNLRQRFDHNEIYVSMLQKYLYHGLSNIFTRSYHSVRKIDSKFCKFHF